VYANPTGSYRIKEGRVFNDHVLCVQRGPLRYTILHDHHDAAVSGHREFAKTFSSIRRSSFWQTLRQDAESYVKSCDACQRDKALRQPSIGLISPFHPPMKKWEIMSMEFLFDLHLTSCGKSVVAIRLYEGASFSPDRLHNRPEATLYLLTLVTACSDRATHTI
jgi:Integrase zinc binding domain